ncbi:hypothetical protein F0562_012287 [Nyssa sinensis]|uniref:Reverse transcriptase Ty1/copia-type domain-containing protein n=1 Tax=Nyssa sinensis TaxID=561372 RepID=A0A5J4ZUQ2_9ASTE|nr:hypothetical protein F0562_012287 [Nyssa sinensis]
MVIFALISSLSESIIAEVIGCRSARDVWLSLEKTYASTSQARVVQTQLQLASLNKGSDSISAYYRRVKSFTNTIGAAGRPLPSSEFVPYLLAGLGPDYEPLVSSVTTRIEPIGTDELLGHLLSHEARLHHHATTAYLFSPNEPFAKLCISWTRFNQSYTANLSPSAHYSYSNHQSDSIWYPDTATTNHVTSELGNLNLHASEHVGNEHLRSAKPVKTPMATTEKLSLHTRTKFEGPSLYRSIIGSLQYLSFTKSDLAFIVSKVCQYMHSPRVPHWQSVKRILQYLPHTLHLGFLFTKSLTMNLTAYTDADWARCPDYRRSTNAYLIYSGSNLISWSSKKQPTVARSSTEAEFKAIANATTEVIWVQHLCRDLGINLTTPSTILCDNLGAIYLSSNPLFHARTKHVEIDFHFIRDRVFYKSLAVLFVSSKDQLADVLTKPLTTARFTTLYSSLRLTDLSLHLRGSVETTHANSNASRKRDQAQDGSPTAEHNHKQIPSRTIAPATNHLL